MSRKRIFPQNRMAEFDICPYQYSTCNLLNQEDKCIILKRGRECSDSKEWLTIVKKAKECRYRGRALYRNQYEHRKEGILYELPFNRARKP